MATSSYIKALLGGVPQEFKAALQRSFEYVLDRNLEFGPVDHQEPTANLRGVYIRGETASTPGQVFSVVHGLGRIPNVVMQVMKPNAVNSVFVGDLTVARAADANRLYFTSQVAGATFYVYVE